MRETEAASAELAALNGGVPMGALLAAGLPDGDPRREAGERLLTALARDTKNVMANADGEKRTSPAVAEEKAEAKVRRKDTAYRMRAQRSEPVSFTVCTACGSTPPGSSGEKLSACGSCRCVA